MHDSPEAAEEAFYRAFEEGDTEAMMSVWADSDAITCIHPLQRPIHGRTDVQEGWEQIFANDPPMRFRVTLLQQTTTDDLAIHIVEESIQIDESREPHAPVLATNIYVRTEDGWRLMLHHTSPAPREDARSTTHASSPRLH